MMRAQSTFLNTSDHYQRSANRCRTPALCYIPGQARYTGPSSEGGVQEIGSLHCGPLAHLQGHQHGPWIVPSVRKSPLKPSSSPMASPAGLGVVSSNQSIGRGTVLRNSLRLRPGAFGLGPDLRVSPQSSRPAGRHIRSRHLRGRAGSVTVSVTCSFPFSLFAFSPAMY